MAGDERPDLNVVAVGASAGGVEALTSFAAGLPADLPYAVLVVLHMPAGAPSVLARIIGRNCPLPVATARAGNQLEHGTVHVAVPGHHLLVHDGAIVVSEGPTENGHRPAINALFRSVALDYGQRAVGALFSGVLDDGVRGLAAIRSRGGVTIAQSPADAAFPALPQNAIDASVVDQQAPAAQVGNLLKELSNRVLTECSMEPDPRMELENRIAMTSRFSPAVPSEELGRPSGFTCPDCHGSLAAVGQGNYRCHVGHAWTADALLHARDGETERALFMAVRSLQEKAKLSRRLADEAGPSTLRERYRALADEAEQAMSVLERRLSDAYPDPRARHG